MVIPQLSIIIPKTVYVENGRIIPFKVEPYYLSATRTIYYVYFSVLILFQSECLLTFFFPERGVFWPSNSEWPLYQIHFKKIVLFIFCFFNYTTFLFILNTLINERAIKESFKV
jgi:hypothetical protein